MKYGEYLSAQKNTEWNEYYLDYDRLKDMISELEDLLLVSPTSSSRGEC
jgi:SPX domain protein involved in polyphosphate accumulation